MTHSRTFRVLFVGVALASFVILILTLHHWNNKQRVPALIKRLQSSVSRLNEDPGGKSHDENFSAATHSVYELGRLGRYASPAVPALIDVLEGPERHYLNGDRTLRGEAGSALAKIGPDAITPLVGSLDHSDPQVRKLAARSLGEIAKRQRDKAESVVTALAKVTEDEDSVVRMSALEALLICGPAASAAIPALKRSLDDENNQVRDFARLVLEQIDPEAAAQAEVK